MLDQLQKLSIAKEQSNRKCKGKKHSTPPLKRPRIIVPVIRKFGNNLFLRLHLNAPEHTQHFPMPPSSSPIHNTERGGVTSCASVFFPPPSSLILEATSGVSLLPPLINCRCLSISLVWRHGVLSRYGIHHSNDCTYTMLIG